MCGIAAISVLNPSQGFVAQKLEKMNKAQISRGPDGIGISATPECGVGMVRLRVRADQNEKEPINLSDTQKAAYNGEIYRAHDHTPTGGIDEVRALIDGAQSDVDGMYSMAYFDKSSNSIEIWRDSFGIKPAFSRDFSGGVAVASTINALLAAFGSTGPRYEAIQQFMAFGRPIDGGSFFDNITPIPRGSRVTMKNGKLVQNSIHNVQQRFSVCQKDLRSKILEASLRVLPSNRTMGLAVSGGLDSTILACQFAELGVEDLRTVSVLIEGVNDGIVNISELQLTAPVVRSWKHSTITVTPELFATGFEQAPRDLCEPTRLSSVALYGFLADAAKAAGITVLQVGEGADELFMGYSSYQDIDTKLPDFALNFMLPNDRCHYLEALYGKGFVSECKRLFSTVYSDQEASTPMNLLRNIELDHSLEPLLRRSDQILMSRSIEGRTPFLHGDIPKLALSIDAEKHMQSSQGKSILRNAFPELQSIDGPWRDKKPFRSPIKCWLQTCLQDWMTNHLQEGIPIFRSFGMSDHGIALIQKDAQAGREAAIDIALSLISLSTWSNWLAEKK